VSGVVAGIVADDLTGACDAGAPFAARGLAAVVLLPEAPAPGAGAEVIVLDTETRGRPPADARREVQTAAARLAAGRPRLLYKKIDSTLRGPVGDELAGALGGAGLERVFLAPAFPAQRRTVTDGVVHVDGRPAGESAIARDPAFPPTGASVAALMGANGPHPVQVVPLATVRRGAAAVAARLDRWEALGPGALVADAETDDDLNRLARAALERTILLAGSAGLAGALADRLATPVRPAPRDLARPVRVIAGSVHPATRRQLERLRARDPVAVLVDPPDVLPEDAAARAAAARRLGEAAAVALRGTPRPGTLVLTGGETAVAVCRALHAWGLRLDGEPLPGLARATLLGGPYAGLAVVTKAGGFGDPDTLVRLLELAR
jgi:uncharacterized protein YgbK (DUF1537 family)